MKVYDLIALLIVVALAVVRVIHLVRGLLLKKGLGFFVHLVAYPPDDPYCSRNCEDGNYPDKYCNH